jgi:predicted sulfurtransferase
VGAYLRQRHGFDDVRRLKHGIIGYERWDAQRKTEDGENSSPLWVGENFVFDKRRDN